MTGQRFFVVTALAGIVIAAVFLVRSAGDQSVYYLYASEAVEAKDEFQDGRRFRLAGDVVAGSVVEEDVAVSTFQVSDAGVVVDVRLEAIPPPLFQDGVEVLLGGSWQGDVFVADEALIRHEAEYEAPPEGDVPEQSG